jgi:hypothetical protein
VKNNTEIPAIVYDNKNKPLATVSLNGHNIAPGGPLGRAGSMRSFRLLEGELWESWNQQTVLLMRDNDGHESAVRIFALPAEAESSGFIEFV